MPRVHPLEAASRHSNPFVRVVRTIQAKIKILNRALVGCHCPELEEELVSLRCELSSLQNHTAVLENRYGEVRITSLELSSRLRTLEQQHVRSVGRYRDRINSLLIASSSRTSLHLAQTQAFKGEIRALRQHIKDCHDRFTQHRLRPFLNTRPYPWRVDLEAPSLSWTLNPRWPSNQSPGPNPNSIATAADLEQALDVAEAFV
jgi:hypothetical protein